VATFNSNAENNGRYYSYVREDISVPTYFRLRQTDIYGVSETYNPVYADCNLNDSEILIYPNPSNGKVTLANLVTGTPIIIQNLKGEILIVTYARSKEETIDLNSFPSGVYLIRIRDGKKEEIYRLAKQ
ncbi:MAG TPA: T9SS type A sorting domain-containing protein, partial [Cyclobacteriaceae bacterium]